jgi:hypothetical protein
MKLMHKHTMVGSWNTYHTMQLKILDYLASKATKTSSEGKANPHKFTPARHDPTAVEQITALREMLLHEQLDLAFSHCTLRETFVGSVLGMARAAARRFCAFQCKGLNNEDSCGHVHALFAGLLTDPSMRKPALQHMVKQLKQNIDGTVARCGLDEMERLFGVKSQPTL